MNTSDPSSTFGADLAKRLVHARSFAYFRSEARECLDFNGLTTDLRGRRFDTVRDSFLLITERHNRSLFCDTH